MVNKAQARFSHIGGAAACDLVNTVHWRLDPIRRSDKLQTFGDAVDWAADSGAFGSSDVDGLAGVDEATGSEELVRIVSLREDFRNAVLASDRAAAGRVANAAATALSAATPTDRGGWWEWAFDDSPASLTHRIALELVAVMVDAGSARITQCADDACGWIYLDTSPRRNRRWCSSADCGNRNRVRAHASRSRRDEPI